MQSDEIARAETEARMRAFMGYRGDDGDEDDDELDLDLEEMDQDGDVDVEAEEGVFGEAMDTMETMGGGYDGDPEGERYALEAQGREAHRTTRGTAEEVDEVGEDDEMWAEGNDDYLDRVR